MAIQWDATWIESRKHTVEGALERITRMLTKSYLSVKAVKRDEQAKNIYVQHFADNALTYLDDVTNTIKLMLDRVTESKSVLTMSYVPDIAAYNALGIGPLPGGVNIADVEAFVVQLGVAPQTPLSVYVCPSFFTGDVYIPRNVNQRSGTGTILHELSHGVGNNIGDHAYTWDTANYNALNAHDRAKNADTYRAYCQSFDML